MSANRNAHPARQARSRASLQRLLSAAQDILNTQGLDGATIPRIAAKAKLSPANVYRRFADKDALLQEAFLRFLEENSDDVQQLADLARWRGQPLSSIVRAVVAEQIKGLHKHSGILRALLQYVRANKDAPFVRRVQAIQLQGYERMMRLYLSRTEEIRHPDPPYAVRFASLLVSFALRDFVFGFGARPDLAASVGYSDQRLEQEMTRVFLRYLEVSD